jgi:8-oxo-dGTP diphosphatase
MKQVTRIGVYGIALNDGCILLVLKQSGCYKGLWDLPGGGIEFGESPVMALRREFKEEVCLSFEAHSLLINASHRQIISQPLEPYDFHHIGLIYRVEPIKCNEALIPEEIFTWTKINTLKRNFLTPLARQAIDHLLDILGDPN